MPGVLDGEHDREHRRHQQREADEGEVEVRHREQVGEVGDRQQQGGGVRHPHAGVGPGRGGGAQGGRGADDHRGEQHDGGVQAEHGRHGRGHDEDPPSSRTGLAAAERAGRAGRPRRTRRPGRRRRRPPGSSRGRRRPARGCCSAAPTSVRLSAPVAIVAPAATTPIAASTRPDGCRYAVASSTSSASTGTRSTGGGTRATYAAPDAAGGSGVVRREQATGRRRTA